MSNGTRTQLQHYGIAVLSVALASVLTLLLQQFLSGANLALFYGAVAISGRYGGVKAGYLATILSTLAIAYFFILPLYTLNNSLSSLMPLSAFVLVALAIASLCSELKIAKKRAAIDRQALLNSEERNRILVENVPQLVWNARPDGYVEFANQQWYDYTGLTPDTSLGWEWQSAIHPDDLASALQHWQTGLATGMRVEVQYRLKRADGTYRWHIVRAEPLLNSQGEIKNWFGTCTDIDDYKQIEQQRTRLLLELESKQKLLEAVLQQIPAGLLVAEASSGRLLLHNQQGQQIIGEDLLLFEGFTEYGKFEQKAFYPDGRGYKTEELPLLRSLITGEIVSSEEIELVCVDNSRKTILADSSPIRNDQGEIIAALATFYDITERKQIYRELEKSNQTLSTLIAASPLAIVVTEPDTTVRVWNRAAELLFGWSEAEVLGKPVPIVPNDKLEECCLLRESLLDGETLFGIETYRNKRNGSQAMVSISAAPLYDENRISTMMLIFQDITERQQAEVALKESEERFRQLAETIQDVFWVSNPFKGEIYYVSPAYEQIWGRDRPTGRAEGDRESLYASTDIWFETLLPEDRELCRTTFLSQITEGNFDTEYRIMHPDGSVRWIRDRGFPLRNQSGEIYRVVGVAEDITAAKLAENALRQALQRLNFHVENSPLAVIEWDTDLRISRWSSAAEKIFGWQAQEVLGKHFGDWEFVYEEDLDIVVDLCQRIFQGNEPQIYKCNRNYTKDGGIVYCEWYNSTLTDEHGNVVSVLSLILDVTERQRTQQELQQSESKFRLMADGAPVFIWMTGTDGHSTYLNQLWLNFVGQTLEEALSLGWAFGIHPQDYQFCVDKYMTAFEERQPFEMEYRYRRADGEYRWILDKGVPLLQADGTFGGYIGSGSDITDRKLAEQERAQLLQSEQAARSSAETANRIKDEFLAVLSHELRSPLNPILGWTKLLRTRKFDATATDRALETIERNAKLQAQLIEDLLDVSRILQGKLSLNVIPINLASTIDAALETVRLSAEAKNIQIEKIFQPDVGVVAGDPNRLQQVVWNLLTNAIKFTPDNGRVEVRLSTIAESSVQIQVTDTGKGIKPDFLPYVFDYFRQADSGTTRNFGGLGLGLAIVRHIAQAHGGTVYAESLGEGQGATFTVKLPRPKSKESGVGSRENPHSPLATPHSLLAGVRVLAVDDEADMRDYVAFVLKEYGASVTVATSADEALTAVKQIKPDLLVSDIGMPKLDGYMLLQQLRTLSSEQGGQIPAIALTAYAGEYDQKRAIAAGFQLHLPKPVEPDVLVGAIASLLGSRE